MYINRLVALTISFFTGKYSGIRKQHCVFHPFFFITLNEQLFNYCTCFVERYDSNYNKEAIVLSEFSWLVFYTTY